MLPVAQLTRERHSACYCLTVTGVAISETISKKFFFVGLWAEDDVCTISDSQIVVLQILCFFTRISMFILYLFNRMLVPVCLLYDPSPTKHPRNLKIAFDDNNATATDRLISAKF